MSSTEDPPPRTGRLPRNARRRQLLDAALTVFVAQGYHAAAMDDIAVKAGVSKPVLYQHFPGKRDLYLALVEESAAALLTAVAAAMASTTDNKDRVWATVRAYFEFIEHEAGAFRLVFESDLIGEAEVRERVDAVERNCADAVGALIAEDTDLAAAEARLLGAGLAGTAQIAARTWAAGGEPVPREVAIDLVASLVWRGIRGFPRSADQG